jgi:ketosteroid isomerase-like protein
MNHDEVADWIHRYERAWRSPGTEMLGELFTEDATYLQSPYEDVLEGLGAISAMWEAEREGHDEVFAMTSEVFAVEGDRAVVTVEVRYGDPVVREYRDIWLLRFEGGRCAHFEEWPYWPDKPYTALPRA